jgi:UDP-N-acetylglucosamine:LPS N-acetylglucosamine transferase
LEHHYTVEIVDPQPRLVHTHYRLVSRHALWLWATEFKLMDTPTRSLVAHQVFTRLLSRRLTALLKRSQPDLVMTTYPFLSYEVARVMKKLAQPKPLVMLFSDPHEVHQAWLTERDAAATFATTAENYTQAITAGFAPERLHLTGWPVRAQFYWVNSSTRPEILNRLHLNPHRFTVFLQGGGEGAARFARTVENVLSISGLQVILAVGTNRVLLERFSGFENLRVLPFTKEIAPFMAAADVVMGKAGPNMLFEAVTLGKPFIATTYIPGQEKVNLQFIQRHQLGWVALTAPAQRDLLNTLVTQPTILTTQVAAVDKYRQWNETAHAEILAVTKALTPAYPGQHSWSTAGRGLGMDVKSPTPTIYANV